MRMHAAAFAFLAACTAAPAATIQVTTWGDYDYPGTCSLRDAIRAANTNSAQNTCAAGSSSTTDLIVLPAGPYYVATQPDYWDENDNQTGDYDIKDDVIIRGADARSTVIVAPPRDRVFDVGQNVGAFTLEDLTLVGGNVAGNAHSSGGVLYSEYATLTLRRVVVRGGTGVYGGNLMVYSSPSSPVLLERVSVLDGSAQGGGGGGIALFDSSTTQPDTPRFENVTISGNSAIGGGGLFLNGKAFLNNTTLTANRGGGLWATAGGAGGALWLANSIVHGNVDDNGEPSDLLCSGGSYGTGIHSLVGEIQACTTQGEVGMLHGVDPKLSPRFDFGAGIPVHAVMPGSPAIQAGFPDGNATAHCLPADARGMVRAQACTLGAYEWRFDAYVSSTADLPDETPGDGVCASTVGSCTLRAAAMEASASGGRWHVLVQPGTYVLNRPFNGNDDATGGDLDIAPLPGKPRLSFAFVGAGDADDVQIVGGGSDRVIEARSKFTFHDDEPDAFRPVSFALLNATVRGGVLGSDPFQIPEANGGAMGAGILVQSGHALLYNVVVRDNIVQAPDNWGGYAGVAVDMRPEWLLPPGGVGGTYLPLSTHLHMERFAVSGNQVVLPANGSGGGMLVSVYSPQAGFADEPTILHNGTIAHNEAGWYGGMWSSGRSLRLSFLTVTGNRSTDPQANFDGAALGGGVQIRNSILAGNPGSGGVDRDCLADGSAIGLGYLLVGNSAGCQVSGDTTGNLLDVDPRFAAPLRVAGMPIHPLRDDSPALDAIPREACRAADGHAALVDARGALRPGDDAAAQCTLGAVEGAIDVIFADGFD